MIEAIETLHENQLRSWPRLARGVEGLAEAHTRPAGIDWFDVFIRHIPHRVASTTAAVDRESILKRPCFLCSGNLDSEERGIAFSSGYTIYFNPFPIVDRHLTIVHRDHTPQHIAGEAGAMLDIAAALPGYFVIYNGPECGASAPDHMHFQAGSRELFPIEKDTAEIPGIVVPDYARNVLMFRDRDRSQLIRRIDRAIELLSNATRKAPEPLINIALFHEQGRWTVYLFPRGKHRPEVFHTGQLTVSPASIDLCGIFVVPFERDFVRITGKDIASIFREVTLPDEIFNEVAAKL
ncbi:MAG TPA: DUF4922 domain-containing protein [Terriglobia bacterium]|jgi:hypothetical protein